MNINELLEGHGLEHLPIRAWLKEPRSQAEPPSSSYAVESRWLLAQTQPQLCGLKLRALHLGGSFRCLALVVDALAPVWKEETFDEERRYVVYLLNPADTSVWAAVDSWAQAKLLKAHTEDTCLGTGIRQLDADVLELRDLEGQELESELLAGQLLELMKARMLEKVVREQLGLNRKTYVSVVETPMMCKSLEPVDAELWRMHLEHENNWSRSHGGVED
jgi:hypothetical protein